MDSRRVSSGSKQLLANDMVQKNSLREVPGVIKFSSRDFNL